VRTVSQAWGALNATKARERQFFIKVETTPGVAAGDVYIKSHGSLEIPQASGASWVFRDNALHGWTFAGCTLASGVNYATVNSNSSDPIIRSPAGLSIAGSVHRKVRVRVRRIAGPTTPATSQIYYVTSGAGAHGESASYRAEQVITWVLDEWRTLEYDMAALAFGGTDWITHTITQIRIDFDGNAASVFEVQWVAVGDTVLLAKPKTHPTIRTQTLNPDEGRATIGTMSFDAIDIGGSLTDELRNALLGSGIGWRQKRAQYYSGFRQIGAAEFELEDTQLIDRVTYARGVYQFRCRDIQRELRTKIFEPMVARLAQPLSATATTIEIFFNPGFAAKSQGTSYTDGASGTYLYVKIDAEIIRVPAAGIGSTQLTTCTRGVLGTRPAAHTTDENATASRAKSVTEVIYLELPVPKLVYALLTGNLIGEAGTLPAHWNLGIDAGTYVRLADFSGIGSDFYVQADDTQGMIERYVLTEAEDGKVFIERDILRKYGLFMPIYADGAIGLRRGQPVLSGSAVVGILDDSMIVQDVTLTYAMEKVINEISIGWNEVGGEPTRFLEILDTDSVDTWGTAARLEIVARGLVGSRQTDSRVRDIFEGLRDRYSGPPLLCDVTVMSSQSLFEVGDVIRLRTSRVRDFTNSQAVTLDRAFEIQGVQKDLARGTVRYSLFGSSQKAGSLPPLESTAALADAFYSATGTNIAGLPGVTDSGTELILPNGLAFTGSATVAGSVYYALKSVRVPSGSTVTYSQNVQLRIRGTLQVDGELNGAGRGLAGVADTVDVTAIPAFGDVAGPVPFATQPGLLGYFGRTQAAGALIERVRGRSDSASYYRVRLQSVPATISSGQVEAIPSLNLIVGSAGTAISGVPADLRGTSGGPGGVRHFEDSEISSVNTNRGGTGGAGGAGLLVICRGFVFGASGFIDCSGADGAAGVRVAGNQVPAWSGGGAGGAPGATVILLDGSSSSSPLLTAGTVIADYGLTPEPGTPHNYLAEPWIEHVSTRFGPSTVTGAFVPADRVSFYRSSSAGLQAGIAAARFFFLLPPVTAEDDVTDVVLATAQDISIAVSEAFTTVDDPTLTVLQVDVTEVATTAAYSHANIYTRRTTGTNPDPAFIFQGGADPRLRIILPADGQTYTVRAVPVLINGVEATTGIEQVRVVSAAAQRHISTFTQTDPPTATGIGDVWIDTDDGNRLRVWNGATWQDIRDATIATAQATADSKIQTTRGTTAPLTPAVGDLWVDTSTTPNITRRWSGSAWDGSASYNTGTLAQRDTIRQVDLDNYAVARVSYAETPDLQTLSATVATWNEIETVTIAIPTDTTNSAVLIDGSFWYRADDTGSSQLQTIVTIDSRILDEDNVVIKQDYGYVPIVRSTTAAAAVGGARAQVHIVAYVTSANLNAGVNNTFKLQVQTYGAPLDDERVRSATLRATLINKAV